MQIFCNPFSIIQKLKLRNNYKISVVIHVWFDKRTLALLATRSSSKYSAHRQTLKPAASFSLCTKYLNRRRQMHFRQTRHVSQTKFCLRVFRFYDFMIIEECVQN